MQKAFRLNAFTYKIKFKCNVAFYYKLSNNFPRKFALFFFPHIFGIEIIALKEKNKFFKNPQLLIFLFY